MESQGLMSVILMLMVGHQLKVFAKWSHLPFTVIVCFAGFLVGLIPGFSSLRVINEVWMELNPHFMLFIFLPALIFESAFNADYYTFSMQFWKIILLAGPMLICTTFLTASAMYWCLGYYKEELEMADGTT